MQVTVCGRIFPSTEQSIKLDLLMRNQSACMRIAYRRLCERKTKSYIESSLKNQFPDLNSRYRRDGYFRAITTFEAAKKLVEMGMLESTDKIIFGGRKNLRRRERGELSSKEWQRLRNNQLYSRGDKSKRGNLNLRFVKLNDRLYLRVNTGNRTWTCIPAYLPKYIEHLITGTAPYGVRILRKNKNYEVRINLTEEYEEQLGFEKGAVGIDFNHNTIDIVVTNAQGQLKDERTIDCHALTCARRGKREWLIGNLVKKIVRYGKYWRRGLVIERLHNVTRGQSNQHQFTHRKFLEALKRRAERESIQVRIINPAYTSIIGRLKYAPYYHLNVHQAAALVIARRGQGFSERLRRLKFLVLKPMEGGEVREHSLGRRVHAWCLWRKLGSLPSRKGTDTKYSNQPYETSRMESWRTRYLSEKSLGKDDRSRGKTGIPGIGPSLSDVKRIPHSSREGA